MLLHQDVMGSFDISLLKVAFHDRQMPTHHLFLKSVELKCEDLFIELYPKSRSKYRYPKGNLSPIAGTYQAFLSCNRGVHCNGCCDFLLML